MKPLLNIELVEFYELHESQRKESVIAGTVHIYLINEDVDVRGLFYTYRKNDGQANLQLPHQWQLDENGHKVRFPTFTFVNREKTKFMIEETIRKVTELLKEAGRI